MKKTVRTVLRLLMRMIHGIFSYDTMKAVRYYKNVAYSYWISNSLQKCGKEPYFGAPVFLKGGKYISVGEGFHCDGRLRIECWDEYAGHKFTPSIVVGNGVVMNYNVHIGCIDRITIGNNVLFASNIFVTDHQHGYVDKRDVGVSPRRRMLNSIGPVTIGDDVWIGENVAIMPNVNIGEGCIIGANSVVTKSFPKNSIVAGVPARLIRSLEADVRH